MVGVTVGPPVSFVWGVPAVRNQEQSRNLAFPQRRGAIFLWYLRLKTYPVGPQSISAGPGYGKLYGLVYRL